MSAKFTIPTVFSAIDKISGPVKKMSESVDTFAARSERSIRKFGDTSMKIARTTFVAGAALLASLGVAANSAAKFETRMSNVATLVDTNKESMKGMSNEVLKLSTKLPSSIDDLSSSLYDIRSAGIAADKAMGVLESASKLSAAGLSTASEATNIMTSALNAFSSEGLNDIEVADILFKTVKAGKTTVSQLAQAFGATAPIIQSAGVKLADFQAATAALTTVGTPASQAQNQIRAAIVALQKPTAEMDRIFKKLGVTTEKQLIQKFGGLGGAFQAVNESGEKMGINMAKAWSSIEAGSAVTSLVGATNKAYVDTLKSMTDGSIAIEDAFKKQLETAAAQSQLAKNNMEALTITIGTEVVPILNKLIQKIVPVVQSMIAWAQENPGTLKTIVSLVAGVTGLLLVVSAVTGIIGAAAKIIAAWSIITKIATGVQWLWNAAMLANPIGLVIIAIAALVAWIAIIVKKWNDWGAAIAILSGPIGWIISLIQSFRRNWDMITESFKTGGMLAGIKAIGKTILDAVLMPIQQIVGLIAKVTGAQWAQDAVKNIEAFRTNLGVNTETKPVSTKVAEQDAMVQRETTKNYQSSLTIEDKTGRAKLDNINPFITMPTVSGTLNPSF